MIDDNARQHKTQVLSLGTITTPDAIDSVVSLEARIERVMPEPSVSYLNVHNVPHVVDLHSKHGALGTHTMVSNNEDMTLSVSTRGL